MREQKECSFQPAVEKSYMKDREAAHYLDVDGSCEPVQLQVQHYAAHVFNELVNYTIEDQDRFLGEIREKLVNARMLEIEQLTSRTREAESSLNHLIP